MLDQVIHGATIVDGTGRPSFEGSIGVLGDRIVAIGDVDESSRQTTDGHGLVLCPGFVDPHTHYDAQFFWDPFATPSNVHGITTVLNGNCGFGLAPLHATDAPYTRSLMAKVEGMPIEALETGVPWQWESFGQYLEALEGGLAVNAGWLVGHSALRRYVIGPGGHHEPATDAQLSALRGVLGDSLRAGALGLSTDLSEVHRDGDGQPVPSHAARREEVLGLCAEVGAHPGTFLGGIFGGCSDGFTDDQAILLQQMSATAGRPLNWNVLVVDAKYPERIERHLLPSKLAHERGGRVVGLMMPVIAPMTMSFLNYCALNRMPGWAPILDAPVPERIEMLGHAANRRMMERGADSEEAGQFRRLADWGGYTIGEVYSEANRGLTGRRVVDIASERGANSFDTLVDIVLNDDLRTILWPSAPDDDEAHWAIRRPLLDHPDIILGGSDAGAHLDRMCGGSYTTQFLADMLRGRRYLSLEQAVQALTDVPARLFGLRERGRLQEGWIADMVLFDPSTVASDTPRLVHDLPGGSVRMTAASIGIVRTWVNGVETIAGGRATGRTPGAVLRSGRDTETVAV
jgi:N-acyl-D-aspartate/D-glutamate deacylase